MTIILAIISGLILGYMLERGDLCFHSTLRGPFRSPRELDLMRAYLLIILVAAPLVWGMKYLGWIEPWIPPFAWQANLIGGLIFGVGMVVAATCITGLFYKLGHGMLGTVVALLTWFAGDVITYRGVLSPVRETLNKEQVLVDGQAATLLNFFGPFAITLVVAIAIMIVSWLWRSPRQARSPYWSWPLLGISVGLFTALAWLLAKQGGANYTFGTSGVPAGVVGAISGEAGGGSLWIPVSLVSIILGALIAAIRSGTLWVRGETWHRYGQLAVGGFLMGCGAAIAGGCNLGHGLVGVPLLSMGSIVTVVAMVVGVWLADRSAKLWALTSRSRALAGERSG